MISQNEATLKLVPDRVIPIEIKERFIKVKRGIMRRMVENQVKNESLRKWTLEHLKSQIKKMNKMDRIELHEYKRQNDLGFYKKGGRISITGEV
jgi:xylose isomerase